MGLAATCDREAMDLLAGPRDASDPVAAAAKWMDLAERDPPALLPAPPERALLGTGAVEAGLYWPAREVALTRLGSLPETGRRAVEARWGARAAAALEDALRSSVDVRAAVEDVAARWPVTEAGGTALILCAEAAAERADDAGAARHLGRWFRLRPFDTPVRKATAGARLADALVRLEDEAGILVLARRLAPLAGVEALVRGGGVPAEEIPVRALAEVRARVARRAPAAAPPPLPERLSVLWSLDTRDPNLVPGHAPGSGVPTARVAVDGGAVYVVEARRVRRVDRDTGLVRWSYPRAEALGRDHDPEARAREFEAPVRDVVVAGGLVLAVLGDPPIPPAATFLHENTWIYASERSRESRARVVALDPADGRAVWWSGRIDETDPVVGAADTAVASPLLVDRDVVYAVLSARRGAVESWLAAFDLASGRVRRVTYLARGESGRVVADASVGGARDLVEARIRSLPRAQRPARRGDEIAVVTGAGTAAGVDAATGRLAWVQALPRYASGDDPSESDGSGSVASAHAPTNEPLAAFGAWFVAAEDSPVPVALEQGTGRMRWLGPAGGGAPPSLRAARARHLLGVTADARGRGLVRFAGNEVAVECRDVLEGRPRTDGRLGEWFGAPARGANGDARPADLVGRPLVRGASVYAMHGGTLRVADPAPSDPTRALHERSGAGVVVPDADVVDGDLLAAGDALLVVGADRVVALAPEDVVRAVARAPGLDGADRAARACLLARVAPSRAAAEAAVAASAGAAAVRAQALPAAIDALLASKEGVVAAGTAEALSGLLDLVDALEPPSRARAYRTVFRGLERDRPERVVELLDRWLPWGDRALVDVDPAGRVRVRSDFLAAHELLARGAATAAGRAALERREARAEVALAAAADLGEAATEEAIRRAAGTRAAWRATWALLARRIDAGRHAEAAATAADLRTRVPLGVELGSAAAHGLRGLEADLLTRAGERAAASAALFDADRDGPLLARTLDGGPAALLSSRLSRLASGPAADDEPEAVLTLFPGRIPSSTERRDATVLEPTGPGAGPDLARVVVARGLEYEVQPLPAGPAVPVAPSDAAYLGAVLQDREPSMPGPGVRVASVTPGGAADRGGLREGDWIVRFGREEAGDRASLVRAIAQTPIGASVRVEALRAGRALALDVAPARRARTDRAPSVPSTCYLPGDGTVVLASRFGLERVSLETGASTPIWRSRGHGDLDEATGFGGVVYAVAGSAPLCDATVVAVEVASGVERWATTLEGRALAPPRVVGSALVVDTREPSRTFVLDRATGSVRGSYARAVNYQAAAGLPVAGLPAELGGSVDAGGTVFLWRDGDRRGAGDAPWLTGVDPATGVALWNHAPDLGSGGRLFGLPLAGGGLLATAAVDERIDVFLPDLRGGVEPHANPLPIDGPRFGSSRWGVLTSDSRLAVGGDLVYVSRISKDGTATVGSVEVDRRAARGLSVEDPLNWRSPGETLLRPNTSTTLPDRNDLWPTLASFRATQDGAWACATTWRTGAEGAVGRSVFVSPTIEGPNGFVPVPTESSILYARGPVLVGARVLVPTDGGYVVLRRRPADAR